MQVLLAPLSTATATLTQLSTPAGDIPIGVTGIILNALLTAFAVRHLVSRIRTGKSATPQGLYEDQDGAATEESQSRYEKSVPKITIALLTSLGIATSLAIAIFAAANEHVAANVDSKVIGLSWGYFMGWIFIATQGIVAVRERVPSDRYSLALNAGITSLIQTIIIAVTTFYSFRVGKRHDDVLLGLSVLEFVVSLALVFVYTSFETRPEVYGPDGRPVDAQNTTTFLSRNTYAWATPIMQKITKKEANIEVADLPALDSHVRSTELLDEWHGMGLKDSTPLWLRIFWIRRRAFLAQYSLSALTAFLNFGPQLSMWQLLRALERQGAGATSSDVYFWVVIFGLSGFLGTFAESRCNWIVWANTAIPVRAQLSALVFEKAMRRKDTREPPAKVATEEEGPDGKPADAKDKKKKEEEDDKKPATDQDTINLLAIDTLEIHHFCFFSIWYVSFVIRFVISIVFLLKLVGWQSLVAGLLTNLFLLPENIWLSKRYSKFQKELMKARDKRTKVLREALNGMRQIKFSALEDEWEKQVNAVRDDELAILWRLFTTDAWQRFCFNTGPPFLAAASLGAYSLTYGALSPSVAFTSIGVFMGLESTISVMPDLITYGISCKVSCDRIGNFLKAPEKEVNTHPAKSVSFDSATVAFPSDSDADKASPDRFLLRNINLKFPDHELSVISGKTGSGKSLLLSAILGEVDVISGNVYVPRAPPSSERYDSKATADNWIIPEAIAYVSQTPWIENASIKDNILFGLPFDENRYKRVLKAAALVKDLEQFEDRDLTEVGAQGISLSGGQRWRLTMARALYSRAGILVMDDLFSALDAHVGKEIYENGLTGELANGRTRILVTHHVALCLSRTKYTVRLANGTVEYAGLVEELEQTGDLKNILKSEAEAEAEDEVAEATVAEQEAAEAATEGTANGETANGAGNNETAPAESSTANADDQANGTSKPGETKTPKKLIEDEKREKGNVKSVVYTRYIKASGGWFVWTMILVTYLASQGLTLTRSWWIKLWTSGYEEASVTASNLIYNYAPQIQMSWPAGNSTMIHTESADNNNNNAWYYLRIYVFISIVYVIISTARYLFVYLVGLRASRVVFRRMTYMILRMPLRWIDTVPIGRILNRFTADTSIMDGRLTHELSMLGSQTFELLGVLVAGVIVSPWIILLALVMLGCCSWIAAIYLGGAREVKRLESTVKSPIFDLFGSSLKGVTTIRAFGKAPDFTVRMHNSIDKHTNTWWYNWLFNRWIGFYLSVMGNFFATAVAAVVVTINGGDASLAGFALAFAMGYTQACIMTVRVYASSQISMNATERVLEYTDLTTEVQDGEDVPASWPTEGKIDVKNLVVSYAEDLPAILKGLNFSVGKCERIGVVGRTGAGKSTLSLALFRFLEAREGAIYIDGVDISKIKLKILRTRLAVIPQDPVLFSGTIRSNLDPFNHYTDEELKRALQSVHLTSSPDSTPPPELAEAEGAATAATSITAVDEDTNTNIFRSLSSPISDGGQNISQGQRQLLCLAREIVSRPKIMILDEATSAVDMATDKLIQRSIREEFSNTTLLVIAHRLSTVADFDKILVMGDGKAMEFGTPKELYEIENGVFRGMVENSGEKEKLKEIIHG